MAVVSLALLGSCMTSGRSASVRAGAGTSAAPPPPVASDPAPVEPPGPDPPTGTAPVRLDPVVVLADPRERPTRWSEVMAIPFGPAPDELGYVRAHPDRPGRSGNLAVLPTSFAVGSDGGVFVLDPLKERVARYSPSGVYLGGLGHLPWASAWEAQDVLLVGDDVLVLGWNAETTAARAIVLGRRRQTPPVPIELDGRPATIDGFLPGASRPTGLAVPPPGGATGAAGGWVTLDLPGTGSAQPAEGIPVDDGMLVDLEQRPGSSRLRVTFAHGGRVAELPVLVRLLGPHGTRIDPIVSVRVEAALPHGLLALVRVSPRRASVARRVGSDLWFLSVSADGRPLEWDRLPEPEVADEVQERHLTVGADGAVYLMVASPGGVTILRRVRVPGGV